jgi:SAM-dependent methyltransferase
MSNVISFEAHRFQSASRFYLAGRPAYSPRLIDRVAQLIDLRPDHRVMDLGCGPGQLALAFAPRAREVVALDPEPEMLRQGEDSARRVGLPITFIEGSSYDLSARFGAFHLVTIGRAFHWMDRHDTLHKLDELIDPLGGIALFSDQHPDVPDNGWHATFQTIIEQFSSYDQFRTYRRSSEWEPHESILLASAFAQLERISVIERRNVSLDGLIQRAFSLSSTSPSRLGVDRAEDLARLLRQELSSFEVDGRLTEVIATEALIARRLA